MMMQNMATYPQEVVLTCRPSHPELPMTCTSLSQLGSHLSPAHSSPCLLAASSQLLSALLGLPAFAALDTAEQSAYRSLHTCHTRAEQ